MVTLAGNPADSLAAPGCAGPQRAGHGRSWRERLRTTVFQAGWGVTVAVGFGMVATTEAGPIRVDPDHPHTFVRGSERWFPMGDTAYFLIAQPTNVIARYIDVRRAHRFNFIRAIVLAEGFWPFGGTPGRPVLTEPGEAAFRKWDWVFDYAADRGMNLELILLGYGDAGGESLWNQPELLATYLRTVVGRFKDRDNLFLWTIANEFERHPDGRYEFSTADVEWAREVAAQVRALDPVHLVGCHPSVWITDQDPPGRGPRPPGTYRGFTQGRPAVVGPLWRGSAMDVNVTQNNEGVQRRVWGEIGAGRRGLTYLSTAWEGREYPATWTESGWDFAAPGMEDSIRADWTEGKPVLNAEFGYQYEPGYEGVREYDSRQCHQPAAVRRKAWRIAVAGGYFAAGFLPTAVRHFDERDVDSFRPAHLEVLYEFFTGHTEYWRLSPHLECVDPDDVLLALPGREYVAYFPEGGPHVIDLVAGTYQAQWLNPQSGRYLAPTTFRSAGGREHLTSPPSPQSPQDDWVLHLRVVGHQ